MDSPSHLGTVTDLQFVKLAAPSQPPDYSAIRKASDERIEAARQAAALQAAQLAAEAERQRLAALSASTGGCSTWLTAAGITDIANATRLINMESGCNPWAVNRSSGACNVAQELPCGKSGCVLGDGACSVAWMNRYVINRYTSWANAVAFHLKMDWY